LPGCEELQLKSERSEEEAKAMRADTLTLRQKGGGAIGKTSRALTGNGPRSRRYAGKANDPQLDVSLENENT
jgi:hypothetical protein